MQDGGGTDTQTKSRPKDDMSEGRDSKGATQDAGYENKIQARLKDDRANGKNAKSNAQDENTDPERRATVKDDRSNGSNGKGDSRDSKVSTQQLVNVLKKEEQVRLGLKGGADDRGGCGSVQLLHGIAVSIGHLHLGR